MPNTIFNTGITTYIYIQNSLQSSRQCSASVAQLAESWSIDPGWWVQFPARGLGVALFATGPRLGLKMYVYLVYIRILYFKKSICLRESSLNLGRSAHNFTS